MITDATPYCPLPGIGPCAGERCNFWDPEEGCTGVGLAFAAAPSLEEIALYEHENPE